jgi:quercetin dioxygenase-like cupin family protein/DNA-binding XRE family transcriptional regulator
MAKLHLLNEPAALSAPDGQVDVGKRLRQLRTVRGLSLRALAEKSGLNVNTLSMIENQRTSPSVSTLQQVAQTLQVPISAFFETDGGEKQVAFQKNGTRPQVAFPHGSMEDLGTGLPRYGAEPLIVTLEPQASSGETPIVHTGREFVYCLDGRITYSIDTEIYQLEPGDSLFFEAFLPHSWKNKGDVASRHILILSPADERDHPTERHFSN